MSLAGGIRARLVLALLAVVGGALAGAYLMVIPSLERRLVDAKLHQLYADARQMAPVIEQRLLTTEAALEDAVATLSVVYSTRVAVFDVYGSPPMLRPRADSGAAGTVTLRRDPVALQAADAKTAATGRVQRAGREFAEAAVPLLSGPVLVLSSPLADQLATVEVIERRLLYATAVALGITLTLGSVGAALHARRIRRLEGAAERIAAGRFDEAIVDTHSDELGELARTFDRMRVQLAALDNARKEFVANASHELRTPLFSLAGFLELLADEELDEETRRGFLETTREQVDRLTALATDLLDLSRLDAGRMRLEREEVSLREVAQTVTEELGPVAEASGHALALTGTDDVWAVGDEERVLQIARALARNALVHTPSGCSVRLATHIAGSRAVLEVADDGSGIAPEHQARIFQRFYRVEGTRASGSGLGLAIAHELASRMGGSLTVRSDASGSVFRLALPRDQTAGDAEPAAAAVST